MADIKKKQIIYGVTSVTIVLLLLAALAMSIIVQMRLERARVECEEAIYLFLGGSDELTQDVFAYADTRDALYMRDYFEEAYTSMRREEAMQRLDECELSEVEREALAEAVRESYSLMKLELHAMRLIAESAGMAEEDMPRVVAEYELNKAEGSMSPYEKYLRAKSMLFGREYMQSKEAIIRQVDEFNLRLNDRYGNESTKNVRNAWGHVIAGMVLFAIFCLQYIRYVMKYETARHAEIKLSEACFRIVAEQSGRYVFRYDIRTHAYHHVSGYDGLVEPEGELEDFPERMINKGVIASESIAAYRRFFAELDSGNTPEDTDIRLIEKSGEKHWYRFTATPVGDIALRGYDTNKAGLEAAVVSYFECEGQRERELAYSRWMQETDSLDTKVVSLHEWNITRDVIENVRGTIGPGAGNMAVARFDVISRAYAKLRVHEDDLAAFASLMNRAKLIGLYHSGTYSVALEYRELGTGGVYRWIRLDVRLVMYPKSNDIKAYLMYKDIDREKREELATKTLAETDALTGLMNRKTFAAKVAAHIAARHSGMTDALLMLDLDGFKRVNDTLGHMAGDKLLIEVGSKLTSALRRNDLASRIGGDEFMVYLCDMKDEDDIAKKAERICALVRECGTASMSISTSMGVAVSPRDGDDFDSLYHRADVALYHVKNIGKDGFDFYREGMAEETREHTISEAPASR